MKVKDALAEMSKLPLESELYVRIWDSEDDCVCGIVKEFSVVEDHGEAEDAVFIEADDGSADEEPLMACSICAAGMNAEEVRTCSECGEGDMCPDCAKSHFEAEHEGIDEEG